MIECILNRTSVNDGSNGDFGSRVVNDDCGNHIFRSENSRRASLRENRIMSIVSNDFMCSWQSHEPEQNQKV